MNVHDYGLPFFTLLSILVLLAASPALSRLLVAPRNESFTEFWVLDTNHEAKDYPYNITRSQNYTVFLGIGNNLGYCAYYLIEVKFRNDTQPAPSWTMSSAGLAPSGLPSIVNVTGFVADRHTLELPLMFLLNYTYDEALSQVTLQNIVLNEASFDMRACVVAFNSTSGGFSGHLFFELWLFDRQALDFRYHERFVSLGLNMTV